MDIKFVANDFLNKILWKLIFSTKYCGSIRICGYHV